MNVHLDDPKVVHELRDKIIGLGEHSFQKSYYPQLSQRIIQLERTERALRESEEFHRITLNNISDAVFLTDMDANIGFVCANVHLIFGWTDTEILAMGNLTTLVGSNEIHPQELINNGQAKNVEWTITDKKGEIHFLLVNMMRVNIRGQTYLYVCRDISDRKIADEKIRRLNEELEQRVLQRTAQLEAVNRELEAFAYTVSHDLRAPLRNISGFSSILSEDYADKLEADAREYINRIQGNCKRMEQLIDAILRLSRFSRIQIKYETVNLSEIASEIVDRLKHENPERNVEVSIMPGMVVEGDAILLHAVLENLLGNAWKFTSRKEQARIEFGVRTLNNEPTFYIQDNGAGFDMAYAEKLFGAFQRLHRDEEFPGIGIGLATVQRIINRHGGSIWAQGAIDKGATFYFKL
jgi:PAS domain S-box-containing protein